jgi:hypothetical protein
MAASRSSEQLCAVESRWIQKSTQSTVSPLLYRRYRAYHFLIAKWRRDGKRKVMSHRIQDSSAKNRSRRSSSHHSIHSPVARTRCEAGIPWKTAPVFCAFKHLADSRLMYNYGYLQTQYFQRLGAVPPCIFQKLQGSVSPARTVNASAKNQRRGFMFSPKGLNRRSSPPVVLVS